MVYTRPGLNDDRRRRLLADERTGWAARPASVATSAAEAGTEGDPSPSEAAPPPPRAKRPGESPLIARQPRVTDLVPQSLLVLALGLLGGLAVVAGLVALYAWMPELARYSTDGRIAAFDLDGEGGLAVWFSSATLALASAVAWLIYSIRKQRPDDYHGHYRIWLAASACWLLMSLDEGGSLHEGFKEMMAHLTGQRLLGDGSIWWVAPYLLLLGVVGVRLVMDMRPARLSIAAFLLAGASYAAAVIVQLELVMPEQGARAVMVEEACEMVGNLLLLWAMLLHARYVVLEAEGQLPARAPRGAEQTTRRATIRKAALTDGAPAAEPARAASTAPTATAPAAESKPAAATAPAEAKRSWFGLFGGQKAKPAADAKRGAAAATSRETKAAAGSNKPEAERRVDRAESPLAARASRIEAQRDAEDYDDADDADERRQQRLSKAQRKALRRQRDHRARDEYDDA